MVVARGGGKEVLVQVLVVRGSDGASGRHKGGGGGGGGSVEGWAGGYVASFRWTRRRVESEAGGNTTSLLQCREKQIL